MDGGQPATVHADFVLTFPLVAHESQPTQLPLSISTPESGEIVLGRSLADFTQASLLVPALTQTDRAGVIKELSQVLEREGCVRDMLAFYHAVLTQDYYANSVLGETVALPHARVGGVARLAFALGRSAERLPWGGGSANAVRLVFLVAIPESDPLGYLAVLSSVASLAKNGELVSQLLAAKHAEAMLAALRQLPVRPSRGSPS